MKVTLLTINSVGRFQECTFNDGGREIFPSGSSKYGCRQKQKWECEKNQHSGCKADLKQTTHFAIHCTAYVAHGNNLLQFKLFYTADLQHCNSCSSFHLRLLYLSPISPCWFLHHSTQAKWGIWISIHILGSQTKWLLWKDDIQLFISFVLPIAAKLASSVSGIHSIVNPTNIDREREMLTTLFWWPVAS